MNFSDRDLINLRKDIEQVRKYEEARRAKASQEQPSDTAPTPPRGQSLSRKAVPRKARASLAPLRWMRETLFGPPEPSAESLEAIPEYVVTLLEVVREQPEFEKWFLAAETFPPVERNRLLKKLSFAFRIEDGRSPAADAFERLQDQSLFKAFCQVLRDEKQSTA